MTRRERAEARLERRREWAAGRQQKAEACHAVGDPYRGDIAFATQPGYIPERARVNRAVEKSFEHSSMANHHMSKARGIEIQLKKTVFSDDPDAIDALKARIEKGRDEISRMKTANKIIRKFKKDPVAGAVALAAAVPSVASVAAKLFEPDFCGRLGFPDYMLTNLGANIRRMEKRVEEITRRQEVVAAAEAAPGGVVFGGTGDYVSLTFAEKPDRDVLNDLREAGFRWGGGCWCGKRSDIPQSVKDLAEGVEK